MEATSSHVDIAVSPDSVLLENSTEPTRQPNDKIKDDCACLIVDLTERTFTRPVNTNHKHVNNMSTTSQKADPGGSTNIMGKSQIKLPFREKTKQSDIINEQLRPIHTRTSKSKDFLELGLSRTDIT